jgi:hypothetical protein
MTTTTASRDTIDIRALQQTWAAIDRLARLRPTRSKEEYERTVALMNFLLDAVGDKLLGIDSKRASDMTCSYTFSVSPEMA